MFATLFCALPSTAEPLRITIALDLHKDAADFSLRQSFRPLFESLQNDDLVGVWAIAPEEKQIHPISPGDQRESMARSVQRTSLRTRPRALLQTVDVMMNHVQQTFVESGLDGKRVMILLSSGPDSSSMQAGELLELLRAAQVEVHSVLVGPRAAPVAETLARETKGRAYRASSPADVESQLAALVASLGRLRRGEPQAVQPTPENLEKEPASTDLPGTQTPKSAAVVTHEPPADTPEGVAAGANTDSDSDAESQPSRTYKDVLEETRDSTQTPSEGSNAYTESADSAESAADDSGKSWLLWFGLSLLLLATVAAFLWWRKSTEPAVESEIAPPEPALPVVNYHQYFSTGTGSASSSVGANREATFTPLSLGAQFTVRCDKSVTRIGRKPDNDIVLEHSGVSGYHAELQWRNGSLYAVDLGSTNGTYLDDLRIEEQALISGQVLRFDAIGFQVSVTTEHAATPAQSAPKSIEDKTMVLNADDPMLLEMIESSQPSEPVLEATAMIDSLDEMEIRHHKCLRHTNRIAHDVCSICTRPYCSECLVEVMGDLVCSKCRAVGHV
ncbi:MAG: FHA domain-containing protein [Myxococcota bacterium]|nr:FHA domain-containing protein [Myxococcota bacterium]